MSDAMQKLTTSHTAPHPANDVAQLTPGGPAPAQVPGAGLGLVVLSGPEE